jgi:hypothetical protein
MFVKDDAVAGALASAMRAAQAVPAFLQAASSCARGVRRERMRRKPREVER